MQKVKSSGDMQVRIGHEKNVFMFIPPLSGPFSDLSFKVGLIIPPSSQTPSASHMQRLRTCLPLG